MTGRFPQVGMLWYQMKDITIKNRLDQSETLVPIPLNEPLNLHKSIRILNNFFLL